MPPSFVDDLFGEYTPQAEPEQVSAESRPTDEWDDQMSEVELRLKKASYYRTLLDGHLFNDPGDQIALDIEKEIRQFARHRLGVLLNLTSDTGQKTDIFSTQEIDGLKALAAAFTSQEVAILKTLAAKVLNRPGLLTPAPPKAESQPSPAPKPSLRKREAPEPKPVKKAVKETAAPQGKNEVLPEDGDIIKEGGRVFKVRWIEATPDYVPPPGVQKAVRGNTTFKVVKLDITKQGRSKGGLPMPDANQLSQITAMQAQQAASMAPANFQEIEHRNKGKVED